MKQLCSLSFVLILSLTCIGQGSYTYKPVSFSIKLDFDTAISNALSAMDDYKEMNNFEKEFLYNLNYARKYPGLFVKQALLLFLEAYPLLKPQYGAGLVTEMSHLRALPMVAADIRLIKIARLHASDLAMNNMMSHQSSNGLSTQQRYEKAGVSCGSECINMATYTSALEVLLSLLIDYNVPNLGHRKALLNPKMTIVGVGAATNSDSKLQYTVADLGCN